MHSTGIKKDYYATLCLQKNATNEQVKKMYKKLAVRWHPDKNIDNKQLAKQKFREIAQAYEILIDERKRRDYDNQGYIFKKNRYSTRYNFDDADNLFRKFFKNSEFDTDNDTDFFGAFRRKKSADGRKKYGFDSMFNEQNFWTSGLSAKMRGFSSQKMTSPTKRKRTTNIVKESINGKIVTTKTTTIQKPDGTSRITEQKFDEEGRRISYKVYEKQNLNKSKVSNK